MEKRRRDKLFPWLRKPNNDPSLRVSSASESSALVRPSSSASSVQARPVSTSVLLNNSKAQNAQAPQTVGQLFVSPQRPSAPITRSEKLWAEAYERLRTREQGLKILAAFEQEFTNTSDGFKAEGQMGTVVQHLLQSRDSRRLRIRIAGKSIEIRKLCDKIITFIMNSNSFIIQAATSEPHLALAWSAVSLLLPASEFFFHTVRHCADNSQLLLNSTSQNEAMLKGLSTVSDLLELSKLREGMIGDQTAQNPDFDETLIELYSRILEFEGRVICYLSRNSAARFARNTFKADDWTACLEAIIKADQRCTSLTNLIHHEFERDRLQRILELQQKSANTLPDVLKAIADSSIFDAELKQFLQCIRSDYEQDKNAVPAHVGLTCQWILKNESFERWDKNPAPGLLCVYADPGCGKSVLSRFLVDGFRPSIGNPVPVPCYFFFKEGQAARNTACDALAAILHQLYIIHNDRDTINRALMKFRIHGVKLRGMQDLLWNLLIDASENLPKGHVLCVIDALDECEPKSRLLLVTAIIKLLRDHSSSGGSQCKLKFLITSRPYQEICSAFQPLGANSSSYFLDVSSLSSDLVADIDQFIDYNITRILWRLGSNDKHYIELHLKSRQNRTYLWLHLVFEVMSKRIAGQGTSKKLLRLIERLPPTVSDAYGELLDKVSDADRHFARLLLQLVVSARRPLSVTELNIASALVLADIQRDEWQTYEVLDRESDQMFASSLKSVCGLFLDVYESRVNLIHQTAREYLLDVSQRDVNPSRRWQHFTLEEADFVMARACLLHLRMNHVITIPDDLAQYRRNHDLAGISKWRDDFRRNDPFIDYSATYWTSHFRSMSVDGQSYFGNTAERLCNPKLDCFAIWFTVCSSQEDVRQKQTNLLDWTTLAIASQFGLDSVVLGLLRKSVEVNHTDAYWGTSLQLASARGYSHTCSQLLAHAADPNIVAGAWYGTALEAASANGHLSVVTILLKSGAKANLGEEGAALQAATSGGYDDIVDILLNHGALINLHTAPYGTALLTACKHGHGIIIKHLLEAGADINLPSTFENGVWTPLGAAAAMCHESIVVLLLNNGAKIDSPAYMGATALQAACSIGHESIAKILISRGANPNLQLANFDSPLVLATRLSTSTVMKLLLTVGANQTMADYNKRNVQLAVSESGSSNPSDIIGQKTIAHLAAGTGDSKALDLILKAHPDVLAPDEAGRHPLHYAAEFGDLATVKLLLKCGADSSAPDLDRLTPLHYAMFQEDHQITYILLDAGADFTVAEIVAGDTPLHAAAKYSRHIGADLLIQAGADVSARDRQGNTPLHHAVFLKDMEMVRIIASSGMGLNDEDGNGFTAISLAVELQQHSIVKILIEEGADVNHVNQDGSTPLSLGFRSKDLELRSTIQRAGGFAALSSSALCLNALTLNDVIDLWDDDLLAAKLDSGSNPNLEDSEGWTSLHYAIKFGTIKAVQKLLEAGAYTNAVGKEGRSALSLAISLAHDVKVKVLLEAGADVHTRQGEHSSSILHYECRPEVLDEVCRSRILDLLLEYGLSMDDTNNRGDTPLHTAARTSDLSWAATLMKKGADINRKNNENKTPLAIAKEKGDTMMVNRLKSRPSPDFRYLEEGS